MSLAGGGEGDTAFATDRGYEPATSISGGVQGHLLGGVVDRMGLSPEDVSQMAGREWLFAWARQLEGSWLPPGAVTGGGAYAEPRVPRAVCEGAARGHCPLGPLPLACRPHRSHDAGGGSPGRRTRGCTVEHPAHGTPVTGAGSSEKRRGPRKEY